MLELPSVELLNSTHVVSPSIEFRTFNGHVEWRTDADSTWISLFEIPQHTVFYEYSETIRHEILDLADIVEEVQNGIVKITHADGFGSAVIYRRVNDTYYIVTNSHVIGNMTNLFITFWKYGNQFTVTDGITLVGRDPSTDLAILSFNSSIDLPVITIADSNSSRIGSTVFAIGHPSAINSMFPTVTEGIISAVNRRYSGNGIQNSYFIQHTAPINSGNSGGGLFNSYGHLIGINTLKPGSTSIEGIALAVSSSVIQRVILDLEEYQTTTNLIRANLLLLFDSNPLNCGSEFGACINTVQDVGSRPTGKLLGLQPLDLIVGYKHARLSNFLTVQNVQQLQELILQTRYDEFVQVQYYRNGLLYTSQEIKIGQ